MSAPPYMKLYVGDYLGDTHHLGALEHGAYLLLLMSMWRAGGSLPARDENLLRIARCTPDEWAQVKPIIMPLFRNSRGRIYHKRLTEELAKYETVSGKRSEAGKRGVSEKARKNNDKAEANASSAKSKSCHNQNQNHITSTNVLAEGLPFGELAPQAAAPAPVDLAAANDLKGRGVSEGQARAFIGKVLRDNQLQPRDLLTTFAATLVNGTHDPKSYIAKAAKQIAERRAEPRTERRVDWV